MQSTSFFNFQVMIKQKTPKMKVSLKQFQRKMNQKSRKYYQKAFVSSHIQWIQQQQPEKDITICISPPKYYNTITPTSNNQRKAIFRKKIFDDNLKNKTRSKSRSKTPINYHQIQSYFEKAQNNKNINNNFSNKAYNSAAHPQFPSIQSFGKISQQKHSSSSAVQYQNNVSSPFSQKFIQNLESRQNRKPQNIKSRNNFKQDEILQGSRMSSLEIQQYQQLKKRIIQIQKEVKQIHFKLDQRSVDQTSWRRQFKNDLKERSKSLFKKQQQLKNAIQKMEQITRISFLNKTGQTSTYGPKILNKSNSMSQLQLARTKRLQKLSKQNDKLKKDLMKQNYNIQMPNMVIDQFPQINFALQRLDRQYKSEYDSIIYTNEQKLRMKLNGISALPRIKDQQQYSQDGRVLGDLLSPFAFDPNDY